MTLEEAVAVLNREKHRGYADWERTAFSQSAIGGMVGSNGFSISLDPFEAVAIAEKYEREREQKLREYTVFKVTRGPKWPQREPAPNEITSKPDPVIEGYPTP